MKNYSEDLLNAFMECNTYKEISERTGVNYDLVCKTAKDPEFIRVLDKRRSKVLCKTAKEMQKGLMMCVKELTDIIQNKKTSPQIKINAISVYFNNCNRLTETTDVIARINDLEERLKMTENNDF